MQRVPVAFHDVLRFRHPFLEAGIVGRKLVTSIRCFDQEQCFAIRGAERLITSLGNTTPSEFPNFRTLSLTMAAPLLRLFLTFEGLWEQQTCKNQISQLAEA
jgi:hypothetical protein